MLRNLNDIFLFDGANRNSWHLDVAIESILDGDTQYVRDHLNELLYEEFSSIPNERDYYGSLYRFTSLPVLNKGKIDERKPVISDIKNGALSFANPKVFNDPMDPILREWLNYKKKESRSSVKKKLFDHLTNALDNLKICCLSRNSESDDEFVYDDHRRMSLNPLMWAHYADKHRGVCIEYEITDDMITAHNDSHQVLRINNVRYRDRKVMSDYITLDNALLAKGASWQYENETRLLYYDKNNVSENGKADDYISLSGFRIKSIYLGYRIKKKDKIDVIEASKGKGITLFQVSFSRNDITKLIATEII